MSKKNGFNNGLNNRTGASKLGAHKRQSIIAKVIAGIVTFVIVTSVTLFTLGIAVSALALAYKAVTWAVGL